MTKDEALKLALEALELANVNHWWGSSSIENAITAIKEALMSGTDGAQPEQEPVAWIYEFYADMGHKGLAFEEQHSAYNTPLYTTPPPVAEPHKRKPLSDEEIILIVAECASSHQHTDIHFARAIEAKLKEKNT